jgi:ABC-type Zn uptake system ZnuABC Zn-binding protein ZnuA
LRVVATTSIIGDVVAQIGGDFIELSTLIGPGQDPHSYEPTARDLAAVSAAQVIFVNGWDLEEALIQDLEQIAGGAPLVPISANIEPLAFGEDEHAHEDEDQHETDAEEHGHSGADPHVWFSIPNVKIWVTNVARVFTDLDPANTAAYETNAAAYLAELEALASYAETELAKIPPEKRFLVTNHDSLSYLARDYDFTILGTVIPAASTVAEPSAGDLAVLIEEMEVHNVCAIFTETTVSTSLAQTIAEELESCDRVQVLQLYTGALGPPGTGTDNYIGLFRHTVVTITSGLQ